MKPPPFGYHRPATLEEALAVLAEVGDDAKVLAGGQSLVPLLNMRLAAPGHLVDINRIPGLDDVEVSDAGVRVGATARHARVEHDWQVATAAPVLVEAVRQVAHPTIRNRGTTVGSLVHADPSGEMTAVLSLLDGSVDLARQGERRTVAAADFFLGPLESAVRPGEVAVAATFPAPPPGSGSAWLEVSRRHGDYAVCGVGALVTLAADRRVQHARAAYVSVGDTPVTLDLTEAVAGSPADAADWSAAGALARDLVEPDADIHATAEYRRHLVGVLTARALATAAGRAAGR